ncbi:MAG: hypothetical protein ACRCX2_31450 [Paraclostridium sp.]
MNLVCKVGREKAYIIFDDEIKREAVVVEKFIGENEVEVFSYPTSSSVSGEFTKLDVLQLSLTEELMTLATAVLEHPALNVEMRKCLKELIG